MSGLTKQTKSISETAITRDWHIIDVKDQVLGRCIGEIVKLLQGKHKVNYAPYLDMGDHVVVINASAITITGNKALKKEYSYYSGYPGGQRVVTFQNMKLNNPEELIIHAVKGMLPKNKLRDPRLTRLHVFKNDKHSYTDKFSQKS